MYQIMIDKRQATSSGVLVWPRFGFLFSFIFVSHSQTRSIEPEKGKPEIKLPKDTVCPKGKWKQYDDENDNKQKEKNELSKMNEII